MPSLDVNLLNSALSAMMGTHKFVSEKEFREQAKYDTSDLQVNVNLFHQVNRVGGGVNSIVRQSVPSISVKSSNDKASTNAARQSGLLLLLVGLLCGSIAFGVKTKTALRLGTGIPLICLLLGLGSFLELDLDA